MNKWSRAVPVDLEGLPARKYLWIRKAECRKMFNIILILENSIKPYILLHIKILPKWKIHFIVWFYYGKISNWAKISSKIPFSMHGDACLGLNKQIEMYRKIHTRHGLACDKMD